MRSALRTSAGPYARYAACGSLTASTLDADGSARAVLKPFSTSSAAERTVGRGRARRGRRCTACASVPLHCALAQSSSLAHGAPDARCAPPGAHTNGVERRATPQVVRAGPRSAPHASPLAQPVPSRHVEHGRVRCRCRSRTRRRRRTARRARARPSRDALVRRIAHRRRRLAEAADLAGRAGIVPSRVAADAHLPRQRRLATCRSRSPLSSLHGAPSGRRRRRRCGAAPPQSSTRSSRRCCASTALPEPCLRDLEADAAIRRRGSRSGTRAAATSPSAAARCARCVPSPNTSMFSEHLGVSIDVRDHVELDARAVARSRPARPARSRRRRRRARRPDRRRSRSGRAGRCRARPSRRTACRRTTGRSPGRRAPGRSRSSRAARPRRRRTTMVVMMFCMAASRRRSSVRRRRDVRRSRGCRRSDR